MFIEYDEETFTIKLYHELSEEPYEVIGIDELIELWQHRTD